MSEVKEIRISDIIIPKFYCLFNDIKYMHHIITSGRAGTKSSYMAIKCIFKIVDDDNCAVVVLRKRHNKLSKTVYKECIRAIKRLGLNKDDFKITKAPMEITYLPNGNTIYFAGSDSIDDTKGIIDEDSPIKLVVLDELTEFFDVGEGEDELSNIEATFVRGNDEEFQMLYLYNPPKNPNAPINDWCEKMERRPDVKHVHVDYRDVPVSWIGKKLINAAEALRAVDEKRYNWVWLGLCTGIDELIYYMFNAGVHVYDQELTDAEKYRMGEIGIAIDYGQKNPTAFEAFGIDYDHQCLRGIDEYYHNGREEGQKSPSVYAKDFKEFAENIEKEFNRKISYIFIDPSAQGLAEEIKRLMPDITIKNADNSVKLGIDRVQKLLSFHKVLISSKQKNLIRELGLYEYDPKSVERGKEEPLKVNDHACDAWRYLVMGMWKRIKYFLPKEER
jgi:phage terminase large subunit